MSETTRRDIVELVGSECNAFAERFFAAHSHRFEDLKSGEASQEEQRAEWFEAFKTFEAEAELTMQNALMLWGVVQKKTFEKDFVEAAEHSRALDGFLALTDYHAFIQRMFQEVQRKREQDAKLADGHPAFVHEGGYRPTTPHSDSVIWKRLSELDQRIADIEAERTSLLLERRNLLGHVVEAATTSSLKHEIAIHRWHEEVGLD